MINMKYPIGIQDFESIVTGGYVYIDKTKYIYELVTSGKIYFLNRPRRFGKSLLISTMKYYFEGRSELFKSLAINNLEREWEKYPVFHISFSTGEYNSDGVLDNRIEVLLSEWESLYGKSENAETFGERFLYVIKAAKEKTGLSVVVLVDEYDKPILDTLEHNDVVKSSDGYDILLSDKNRNILKGLYSVFKDADPYLRFVFMTGVTKFGQITVFSGLNQPQDIGFNPKYEAICGITEEELYSVFGERIEELGTEWKVGVEDVKKLLKKSYDGYHFTNRMMDIYNPFSLLNTLSSGVLTDYWFKSGNPEYLIRLIARTNVNIQELVGKYYAESEFADYKADSERPLPMIYQSGYLTFKDYKMVSQRYLLDFPNDEVKRGFVALVANNYLKPKRQGALSVMAAVVESLAEGNTDDVRDQLTTFFASIPYTAFRRKGEKVREQHFQYTFYLLLRILSTYVVYTEKVQSMGRVDCVVETDKYIYVFEFKLDGSAEDALRQIEEKGYAMEYIKDNRLVKKIGCVFSSRTGTISDWMEM